MALTFHWFSLINTKSQMHRVKLHKSRERASIDVQAEQFSGLSRSGETLKVRLVREFVSTQSIQQRHKRDMTQQYN